MRKLWILIPLLLTACMVGPDYVKPETVTPAQWKERVAVDTVASTKEVNAEWWADFKDPTLNTLIERALSDNHDRKIAQARIFEARGLRMSAESSLYPQITTAGNASRSNPGLMTQNNTINLYQASFDASWEIDLFGGNRRRVQASDATIKSREASYQEVSITLVAEIVTEYARLRELQQRYDLTVNIAETQRQLNAFTLLKYQHGTLSGMEADQAEALYRTTVANIPVIAKAITATIYRISVLTGSENDEIVTLLKQPAGIPAVVNAQVIEAPATILSRRPDIAVAERNLAANTALTGVAISEMYPKLSLGSLYGWQNSSILPATEIWSIAGGIAMPLLNFGRIQGNINAADSRQTQAFHTYKQTVIAAVADVETKLSDYAKNREHTVALKAAVDSNQRALNAAQLRYEKGMTPLIDVLDAQNKVYAVKSSYLTATADEVTALAALNKASGL
ncbi:MAG: efflux transporter outer membrane subunit [Methylophilaceae bacterium]